MPRPDAALAPARIEFDAIGTRWSITTLEALPADACRAVDARIEAFDLAWSRFRPDSLVSRIARKAGRYELPGEAGPLLDLYSVLGAATDGAVNPLVGRRLEHLGYGADYAFHATPDPAAMPRWGDAATWNGTHLVTREPVLIDVGAAGKGYLVDLVAHVLADAGIDDFTIDAGGDIRQAGEVPARVALEHPLDPTLAIGVVELRDSALCASAVNRRAWGDDLHHVLDGRTGAPTRDVLATWALAPTALEADGLASALFFTTHAELAERGVGIAFESLRLLRDGSVEATAAFDEVLFR